MANHYDISWPIMRLVYDQSLNYTADQLYDECDVHDIEELIEYQDLLADMAKAQQIDDEN
jgi:hypothetical protein